MKEKQFQELSNLISQCLVAKTDNDLISVSDESEESFLAQNARESKAIEVDRMKRAFYRTRHEWSHREIDSQLRKFSKKMDNHEKKLEKLDAKINSLQNKIFNQEERVHNAEDIIRTMSKQVEKQGKDIHLIKKVYEAFSYCATGERRKKFKSTAQKLIKKYKTEAERSKKRANSSREFGQIEDKG